MDCGCMEESKKLQWWTSPNGRYAEAPRSSSSKYTITKQTWDPENGPSPRGWHGGGFELMGGNLHLGHYDTMALAKQAAQKNFDASIFRENPLSNTTQTALAIGVVLGVGAILYAVITRPKTAHGAQTSTSCADWKEVDRYQGPGRYRIEMAVAASSDAAAKKLDEGLASTNEKVAVVQRQYPGVKVENVWIDHPPTGWPSPNYSTPKAVAVRTLYAQVVLAYSDLRIDNNSGLANTFAYLNQDGLQLVGARFWYCPSGPKPTPMPLPTV